MGPVGCAPVPIDQLQIRGTTPWIGSRANRHKGPRPYQWCEDRKTEIDICLHCPRPQGACDGASTCPLLRRGRQGKQKQAEGKANEELRAAIRAAGLTEKQVYEALHIKRSTWYARLGRELSEELREQIDRTIAALKGAEEG